MTAVTTSAPPPAPHKHRVMRGERYSTISEPPATLPPLFSLDSAFQLQEYIAQLVKFNPHDVDTIVSLPSSTTSNEGSGGDVDLNCWIYEQIRRLAQDLTSPLITLLQHECDRNSCPEMKAGEWLYLCVAHGNGGTMEQCCAIDYALHTLDAATAMLNSPRHFPSRIAVPSSSVKHFASLARRLSRIFAHAYFHHREIFEQAEAENALYERFLGLVREFNLVPSEFLVINWEDRPIRSSSHPLSTSAPTDSHLPSSGSSDSLNPAENDALTRSPLGGRKRTDTMYFSGDFNVLDPAFGIGSLGEGDGLPVEVPKVPSEGQEESDEWVLPERAYGDHESEEGVSHEQEDEGISVEGMPVEVTVEQEFAPEVDERSVGGYTEPRPTPSEEDPFADTSADVSAAEVEAQLEVSEEEPANDEETSETVAESDSVEDEAPVEKTEEGSEAAVAEVAEAAIPELDVSGEHVIEDEGNEGKKD